MGWGMGMFGIELVATTHDGKRVHIDAPNEWGGLLTADEGVSYATDMLKKYGQWDKYDKVEVYENTKGLVHTVYSKDFKPNG
jgi:hypothetical protein